METMKLAACIVGFFTQYLAQIKGCSPRTLSAYRDSFALLLPFAARRLKIKTGSLRLEHLTADLILAFLNHLEAKRGNCPATRNQRLAAIKSFAKMICLLYPQHHKLAQAILSIPKKRTQKQLIGFLYPRQINQILQAVPMTSTEGFRDYSLLNLLYDSGARASEIATLNLQDFDSANHCLFILGKGNRLRQVQLWPKTSQLLARYIAKYRATPRWVCRQSLFVNQRGQPFTRHGINGICKKYLPAALSPKQLQHIHPAHSFRHSCAIRMLCAGHALTDIKNRLGHENIQSTMAYLQLDLSHKRQIQQKLIDYSRATITDDPKINELIDWENKEDILAWLNSL